MKLIIHNDLEGYFLKMFKGYFEYCFTTDKRKNKEYNFKFVNEHGHYLYNRVRLYREFLMLNDLAFKTIKND